MAAPPNASTAATQNRELSRSIPNAKAKSPVRTGSVPNRSATVVAVVSLIAYTNESWFRKIPISRRQDEDPEITAPQRERPLAGPRDPAEEQRSAAEAERGVRDRLEAVRDDVLRDGEVERPERHRREQHQIGDVRTAHASEAIQRAHGRSPYALQAASQATP
jgi:hypothetical protein